MKRAALLLLLLAVAVSGAAARPAAAPAAHADGECALPQRQPTWIDFGDGSVPFWQLFAQPGNVVAASNLVYPAKIREAGADTVYWDMYLNKRVGTPGAPADMETVIARANKLFDYAVTASGCSTPYMAENELFGASLVTPWSQSNAQYRANVLTFLRTLASRGAHPYLLVNSTPYMGGEARDWWLQVTQVADLVREVYFPAPLIYRQGPVLGNRTLRRAFRRGIAEFIAIGIPPRKLGLFLGFQTDRGQGGREGLEPAQAWFETIKWQALAARQAALELHFATIWSWGWATWGQRGYDTDKPAAACVYLWTRNPKFCDGPTAAGSGFDASRTEGQIQLPAGAKCTVDGRVVANDAITRLTAVTGDRDVAYSVQFARAVESEYSQPGASQVLAAERTIVALRFAGSYEAYRAALARAHASIAIARGVIADELRQTEIGRTLPVAQPTAAQIRDYYETYSEIPARPVEARPPPSWLGGLPRGFALSTAAPAQIFTLPVGLKASVLSVEGRYVVRVLGEPRPLGSVPLEQASPPIRSALTDFARADAFHRWTLSRQLSAVKRTICTRDELPRIDTVEISSYLPFLSLTG